MTGKIREQALPTTQMPNRIVTLQSVEIIDMNINCDRKTNAQQKLRYYRLRL